MCVSVCKFLLDCHGSPGFWCLMELQNMHTTIRTLKDPTSYIQTSKHQKTYNWQRGQHFVKQVAKTRQGQCVLQSFTDGCEWTFRLESCSCSSDVFLSSSGAKEVISRHQTTVAFYGFHISKLHIIWAKFQKKVSNSTIQKYPFHSNCIFRRRFLKKNKKTNKTKPKQTESNKAGITVKLFFLGPSDMSLIGFFDRIATMRRLLVSVTDENSSWKLTSDNFYPPLAMNLHKASTKKRICTRECWFWRSACWSNVSNANIFVSIKFSILLDE